MARLFPLPQQLHQSNGSSTGAGQRERHIKPASAEPGPGRRRGIDIYGNRCNSVDQPHRDRCGRHQRRHRGVGSHGHYVGGGHRLLADGGELECDWRWFHLQRWGLHCAEPQMPASQSVIIQAALASNPAITASYTLNIVNPVPVITSVNPAIVKPDQRPQSRSREQALSQATVVQVNGVTARTTYKSATSVIAQVTAAAGSTTLSLLGQNPSPVVGAGKAFSLPVGSIQLINEAAPGSSGPIALGGVSTSFTTSLVNLRNTLGIGNCRAPELSRPAGESTVMRCIRRPRSCLQTPP